MCYKQKSTTTTKAIFSFFYHLLLLTSSKNLAIGYLSEPSKQSTDATNNREALIKFPRSINSSPFKQAYTDTPKKDIVLIQSP